MLGVSDRNGQLIDSAGTLWEAAANDACESHLYNLTAQSACAQIGKAIRSPHAMPTCFCQKLRRRALRKTLSQTTRHNHGADATANDHRNPAASAPNFPTLRTRRLKRSPSHAMKWTAANMCVSPSSAWANWAHRSSTMAVDLIYVVEPANMDTNGMALSPRSAPKWPPRCNGNPSSWAS